MLARRCLPLFSLGLSTLAAEPVRLLVIGDSMSEEYANELPFSAPDSSPLEANTMNWVEILGLRPYLDWIENYPTAPADLLADHDGDGLVNLAEFALQRDPLQRDSALAAHFQEGVLNFGYSTLSTLPGIVESTREASFDLQAWQPLDPSRVEEADPGNMPLISFGPGTAPYVRVLFQLAP